MKRAILVLQVVLIGFMLLLSGCGSRSVHDSPQEFPVRSTSKANNGIEVSEEAAVADMDGAYTDPAPASWVAPEEETSGEMDAGGGSAASSQGGEAAVYPEADRKIIKSAQVSIETQEFDRTADDLAGKVRMVGGYIENSNIKGISRNQRPGASQRTAYFQVRIPEKSFDQFISDLEGLGNIINKQIHGQDITGQYFDTEARLKSLNIQEQRLLTILGKAERLQDIIELERELQKVRYEIENYTGTLKKWDNMVAYASVSVNLYEVNEIDHGTSPPSLWQRIVREFKKSVTGVLDILERMLIFGVAALPYLLFVWIILVVLYRIFTRLRRKNSGDSPKQVNENDE
ncbi:MAG: DUF4349 domain-containing protein [Clostridia bacterium]|jgi:uncharacterized protein YceK